MSPASAFVKACQAIVQIVQFFVDNAQRIADLINYTPEVLELSQVLNSIVGQSARDPALFRNPNGVYMKLANFRAVDPLHTSQGKLGLSRGGQGVDRSL